MESMAESHADLIRVLGNKGEISLGEEYAGRTAIIEEIQPGVWVVKIGEPVPESEQWLQEPHVKAVLDRAIAWATENPPRTTDLDELEERLLRGLPDDPASR
jgi:hypothetical protein